jgi:uncharacterized protein
MLFRINDIGDTPLRFDETLDLPLVSLDHDDLAAVPRVRLRGRVTAGPEVREPAEGARLAGHLETTLLLRCCRCLEGFDLPCAPEFRFTLVAETPGSRDPERAIDSRDTHFFEIEAGKLDLAHLAAELIYLNLPLKPVCNESCAGLCPTCGINRNRLECDCREETVDPRLQVLQRIRDRMGGKSD